MAIDWQYQICNIREERRMRLIDADVFDAIINDDGTIDVYATETARNAMLSMPTVDAVPVIRCKDCIHAVEYLEGKYLCYRSGGRIWYKRDHNGGCLCETGGGLYNSQPEDYCSRAERRNDERME